MLVLLEKGSGPGDEGIQQARVIWGPENRGCLTTIYEVRIQVESFALHNQDTLS
jgi:hypothetical protein